MKKRTREAAKHATQAMLIALTVWSVATGALVVISRDIIPYWAAIAGLFGLGWIACILIAYHPSR